MPADRFFLDASFNTPQVEVPQEELKHLKVMRLREGETLELVNGQGTLATAKVKEIDKKRATLEILSRKQHKRPKFEIILAQAIPRPNRLDLIVEKGTELGMTQLWLFPGDRSERPKPSPTQQERVRHVSTSALKQCGRFYLPEIRYLPPLKSWEAPQFPAFFGDLDPQAPSFHSAWSQEAPKKGMLFLIGPEAGLSPKEISVCTQLGMTGVKLHENILRTDTAPLLALGLISHWLLDA